MFHAVHARWKSDRERNTQIEKKKARAKTICLATEEAKRERPVLISKIGRATADKVVGTNVYLASIRLLNVSDKQKMLSGL